MDNIGFKPFLRDLHIKNVYKWFENEDFYYDTYQPAKIPYSEIDYIIDYEKSHMSVIYYNNIAVGLCDYMLVGNNNATIEFAICSKKLDDVEIIRKILNKYIFLLFNNTEIDRITKYVYEFDKIQTEVFEKSAFINEGYYYDYIFKDNKYWNVAVFSMLREDYNNAFEERGDK